MNISNKTVLITGGGSGIGYEIAKQLLAKGNNIIITGRSDIRLQRAAASLGNVQYVTCDINNPDDIDRLQNYLQEKGQGLDILINNAGHAHAYSLSAASGAAKKAHEEIQTNYLSVIRITEQLLPLLQQSGEAAIVNVSSITAFVPNYVIPTYSASKAALHSYTQVLRYTLEQDTNIKVFDLMPPLVDTEFSAGIGGSNGIPPAQVAESLIQAMENDTYEIHTGNTAGIYDLMRKSPEEAFGVMNKRSVVEEAK